MDFRLEADAARFCVVLVAQRLLDGLDACSRRAEDYRTAAFLRVLGIEEVAVYGLRAVEHQPYQVAVDFVCAVFFSPFLAVGEGELLRLADVLLPELQEIRRLAGVRLNLVYAEAEFDMVAVFHSVDFRSELQVAESRCPAAAHIEFGPATFEGERAVPVGLQHVVGNLVADRAVARDAVLVELYLHGGVLSGPVEPVGVVGYRDPEIIRPVGIIAGICAEREKSGEKNAYAAFHRCGIWL